MPIHIKAFIIIVVIAFVVFGFAKRSACILDDCPDFKRRRNLWFAITAAAFLTHNFWIYVVTASFFILLSSRSENHKVALYILLIFAVPPIGNKIPGFGIINYIFELNHPRLLSLLILLPVFLSLVGHRSKETGRTLAPDRIIIAYILLNIILQLRGTSITDAFRQGFYGFTDAYIPYYVISRTLLTQTDFRRIFLYFVIVVGILSIIAVFEQLRHWMLYPALLNALGLHTNLFDWTMRSGGLRAMASTGHSIVLGYVIAMAIGFMLFLKTQLANRALNYVIFAVLFAGSFATLSRGPWVGIVVLFVAFLVTGPNGIRSLLKWALLVALAIPVIMVSPWGQSFIDLLPYVGSVDSANISYRENLMDNAIIIIMHYPWFGSVNYLETPEMQEMLQGGGIIDVVNTYIGIALNMGLLGLCLFLSFFLSVIMGVIRSLRSLPKEQTDTRLIGRTLIATLLAVLIIIFTVSPISVIAVLYWSLAGMGVAYIRMVSSQTRIHGEKEIPSGVRFLENR